MDNFRKAAILLDDKHLGMMIRDRDAEHTPSSQMEPAATSTDRVFFFNQRLSSKDGLPSPRM